MIETLSNFSKETKRGLAAATALVAFLGAAACSEEGQPSSAPSAEQSTSSHLPDKQEDARSSIPSSEPTNYSNEELINNPDLLQNAYAKLPDAVKQASKAAVQIEGNSTQTIEYYSPDGEFLRTESQFAFNDDGEIAGGGGSGMVVQTSNGEKVILTAGHSVKPLKDHCSELTVNFQVNSGNLSSDADQISYKNAGTGEEVTYPDKGLIITPIKEGQPTAPVVNKHSVNPGDVVFAETYQPKKDGSYRNPSSEDNSRYPAEYSGLVLGETSSGMVAVLERGESYGAIKDTYAVKGASGGGLLNEKGELWGVVAGSTRIEEGSDPRSSQYSVLSKLVDVALTTGNDAIREIDYKPGDGIMLVQPINQAEVDRLYNVAKSSKPCKARPVKRVIED